MEPANFSGHFGAWEEDKWNIEELYTEAASSPDFAEPQVVGNGYTIGYSNSGAYLKKCHGINFVIKRQKF